MPFFQNPFTSEFIGVWVLGDRQASLDFVCPSNAGRGDEMVVVWAEGPYDLSGTDDDSNSKDVIGFSLSLNNLDNWTDIDVTISASSLASTTPSEIVSSLNADANFSDWFVASLSKFNNNKDRITVKQKLPITKMRFYVRNGRAESVLRFNYKAGIAELPSYFAKHTIANSHILPIGPHTLIELGTSGEDANIIDRAVDKNGNSLDYNHSNEQADYALLRGRTGLFMFKKNTVDSSSRITETIEYPAGAKIGDFAKKISYTYTGAKTQPDTMTEVPYVLASGDLLAP